MNKICLLFWNHLNFYFIFSYAKSFWIRALDSRWGWIFYNKLMKKREQQHRGPAFLRAKLTEEFTLFKSFMEQTTFICFWSWMLIFGLKIFRSWMFLFFGNFLLSLFKLLVWGRLFQQLLKICTRIIFYLFLKK